MQQINLIDANLLPPLQRLQPGQLLAILGAASALVLGHYGWERADLARELSAASAAAPLAEADAAAGAAAAASAPDAPQQSRLAQREALRDLLRSAVALPEGSPALITELLQTLPPQVWLTELEMGPQRSLRVSGGTLDSGAFGMLSAGLAEMAALRGLPLHTVRLTPRPAATAGADSADAEAVAASAAPAGHLFVIASESAAEGANPGAAR